MAKYAISKDGVEALRKLSSDLQQCIEDIDATDRWLWNVIQKQRKDLGAYERPILEIIEKNQKRLAENMDAIMQLSMHLLDKADEIEEVIRRINHMDDPEYLFSMDEKGRTISAQGSLKLEKATRNISAR